MGKPDLALATVVHSLLLGSLYSDYGQNSCLEISLRRFSLRGSLAAPETCKGFAAVEQECERVRDRLPGDPADLWQWCLARSRDELLDLLAVVAANVVNGVQRKQDRAETCRLVHAAQLQSALNVDVNGWFTPTAANYFSRINRSQILAAIDEARGEHAPALDKLKKSELAVRAESIVAGTGWLPVPMRIAANENVTQGQTMAVAAK